MTVFIDPAGNSFNLTFDLNQDEVYLNDGNDIADLTNVGGVFAYGGNGNDILSYEGIGQAILHGGAGQDILLGNTNADLLSGDLGNDVLFGGGGRDFLIGGFGADIFQFSDAVESFRNSIDVIRDFLHGEGDTIDLSLIDANPATVAIEHFKFIGSESFKHFHKTHPNSNAALLRFDAKHHTLQGDTHHNLKLDAEDFQVTLAGVGHLVKGDLVIA